MVDLEYFAVANRGGVNALLGGPLASRPAFGEPGRFYFSTEGSIYRDSGVSWVILSGDDAASILAKLLTVDANASGLNATTLQGLAPAAFLAAAGKAVDSDLLDGRDSTTFASLVSGLVPENQIPAVAITDTFEVASQVAMLALVAERGDVAIRSDLNKSFVLRAVPASALTNWAELRTPTDAVLSVDARTGAVSLADLYAAANDARLRTIRDEGTLLPNRSSIDVIGPGVIAQDNTTTGRTELIISGAAAGAASETAAGITEQATQAEVEAGTAGNLFATVAKLKAENDRREAPNAYVKLSRAADQNILDAALTPIAWNSEVLDPLNWHETATNPERITPGVAGVYVLSVYTAWVNNATGRRLMLIRVNGTETATNDFTIPGGAGALLAGSQSSSAVVVLGATDYVTVEVSQTSGGTLALLASSVLTMTRVR